MRSVCCLLLGCGLMQAQSAPQFDTASVHPAGKLQGVFPARRVSGGPGTTSPGRITYEEESLKDLLFMAYRVQFYQLATPPWMDEAYFNVVANVPAGATRDEVARMLQGLLAERFLLKIHRESREMPGYVLTAASGGPKLAASAPASGEPSSMPGKFALDKEGFLVVPPGSLYMMTLPSANGVSRLTAGRASMKDLCVYLSRQLQRPVADQTGLTGVYDFHLFFAREFGSPGAAPPEAADAGHPSDPAPRLTKAVEAQLGLKMQSKRIPVEILVIDHVERSPVGN